MTTARTAERIQDFFGRLQSTSGSPHSSWAKQISYQSQIDVEDGSGADCSITIARTEQFESALLYTGQNSKHSLADLLNVSLLKLNAD